MKKLAIYFLSLIFLVFVVVFAFIFFKSEPGNLLRVPEKIQENYWFILHRKLNSEEMFYGVMGDRKKSKIVKTFKVKAGIMGERPTPLPQLVGREYWKIIKKESSIDNPETAPYFLQLDIPAPSEYPYGPVSYEECAGQCDWILPGYFGLHGVNGDETRVDAENPGSSGCVRHLDKDITYLYNLLDPENDEIRYYIEDN